MLSPTSFEVAGQGYGDESLLVVSAEEAQVQEGEAVQVTGTVREFTYTAFADQYGLVEDEGRYDPYVEEEFLVAENVSSTVPEEE